MRYTRMLLIGGILALTGCALIPIQNNTNNSGQQPSGINEEHQPPLNNIISGTTNEYSLLFDNTSEEKVSIYHQAGESTKLFFINTKTGSMNAKITFEKVGSGNLRLSQIIMPDGSMDGPFSQDTTYDLTQVGGYQLLFRESMMTGDPWSGNAIITVSLR